MSNDEQKTISFKYKISPNFSMYAVSGVHGGLNARGNVIANFYSERNVIPKEEVFVLNQDGSLDPSLISSDKVEGIIRDVLFGISMDTDTARSFARWLIEKSDEFDKRAAFLQQKELVK